MSVFLPKFQNTVGFSRSLLLCFCFGQLAPNIWFIIHNPHEDIVWRMLPLLSLATLKTIELLVIFTWLVVKDERKPRVIERNVLQINPKKIVVVLGTIIFFLGVVNITSYLVRFAGDIFDWETQIYRYMKQFHINKEDNIPTFFSALILIFSSMLFAIIAYFKKQEKDHHTIYWQLLTIGFVLLGFDEEYRIP